MKGRFFSLLLVLVIIMQLFVVSAVAEDTLPEGSNPTTVPTEAPKPTEEPNPTENTKPSEPESTTTPTQGTTPTEPSQPAVCTHSYGDWDADEGSHWKVCSSCGHRESGGHAWASETVTVDPTCGEHGGICKVCTVCQGVLVTELIAPTGKHTYDNACDTACNVCGTVRTIQHTFGTGWKYNGKGHWHYCTVCGAADEVKDHYPGPAATEEKEQICLTCGMVMMKQRPHSHKWDTKWSSDESCHWYSCTICQEKDKMAVHTYDNGCDTDCNDCGYLRTAAHTYGSDWTQTELTHYGVCTVCGVNTEAENHIADSTGTVCNVCGYPMGAATEPHEHIFDEDTWEFDEYGHWNMCMCGEKDNAEPHVWDNGTKKSGRLIFQCDVCQAEKQEEAPRQSIPWFLVLAGGGVLLCLIGIVVCVLLMKKDRREYE